MVGFGVWAVATAPHTGWALGVTGKAMFTRTGVASIAKGKTSVKVTLSDGVDATTLFLATPQSSLGSGVFVTYCGSTTSTTSASLTVRLKAVPSVISARSSSGVRPRSFDIEERTPSSRSPDMTNKAPMFLSAMT